MRRKKLYSECLLGFCHENFTHQNEFFAFPKSYDLIYLELQLQPVIVDSYILKLTDQV